MIENDILKNVLFYVFPGVNQHKNANRSE